MIETVQKKAVRKYEVKLAALDQDADRHLMLAVNKIEAIVRFFNAERFTRPGQSHGCNGSGAIHSESIPRISVRAFDPDRKMWGPWQQFSVVVHDLRPSLPELPERHVHITGDDK